MSVFFFFWRTGRERERAKGKERERKKRGYSTSQKKEANFHHHLSLYQRKQDAGAHYCDITGELSWVASLRDDEKLDEKARAAGVKVVRWCFFWFEREKVFLVFLSATPSPMTLFSLNPSLPLSLLRLFLLHQTNKQTNQNKKQVPCCGYDCIPSDLGAFMVAEELKKKSGGQKKVRRIETVIDGSRMDGGGVSGGTAASALNLMGDSKAMAVASDPYVCFPPGEARERRARLRARGVAPARPYPPLRLFRRSPGLAVAGSAAADAAGGSSPVPSSSSGWAVSWPLGGANCAVVRRSAALLGYGRGGSGKGDGAAAETDDDEVEVEVDETVEFPSLKHAAIFDAGIAAIGAAVFAGSLLPPIKRWLGSQVPQPGQGPSREKMLHAPWRHAVVATAADVAEENGTSSSSSSPSSSAPPPASVRGVVGGPQDRGYYMTARMVLEAGLALAGFQQEEQNDAGKTKKGGKSPPSSPPSLLTPPPSAGILTPAAALGHTLLGRLRAAGFTFEVEK